MIRFIEIGSETGLSTLSLSKDGRIVESDFNNSTIEEVEGMLYEAKEIRKVLRQYYPDRKEIE